MSTQTRPAALILEKDDQICVAFALLEMWERNGNKLSLIAHTGGIYEETLHYVRSSAQLDSRNVLYRIYLRKHGVRPCSRSIPANQRLLWGRFCGQRIKGAHRQ